MISFFVGPIEVKLSETRVRQLCEKYNVSEHDLQKSLKRKREPTNENFSKDVESVVIYMKLRSSDIDNAVNKLGGIYQMFNNIVKHFEDFTHLQEYLHRPTITSIVDKENILHGYKLTFLVKRQFSESEFDSARTNIKGNSKTLDKATKDVIGIDNLVKYFAEKGNTNDKTQVTNFYIFTTIGEINYTDHSVGIFYDNTNVKEPEYYPVEAHKTEEKIKLEKMVSKELKKYQKERQRDLMTTTVETTDRGEMQLINYIKTNNTMFLRPMLNSNDASTKVKLYTAMIKHIEEPEIKSYAVNLMNTDYNFDSAALFRFSNEARIRTIHELIRDIDNQNGPTLLAMTSNLSRLPDEELFVYYDILNIFFPFDYAKFILYNLSSERVQKYIRETDIPFKPSYIIMQLRQAKPEDLPQLENNIREFLPEHQDLINRTTFF